MSLETPRTLYQVLRRSAEKFPQRPFLADIVSDVYRVITYQQCITAVKALAFGLRQLGLKRGDKVALMVPNGSTWAIVDLACAQLGLIDVPIHTTYSFQYLSYTIQHSGSQTLIIQDTFYAKFKDQLSGLNLSRVIVVGDSYEHTLNYQALLSEGSLEEGESDQDAVHTIIYTSGTTAEPKGVMLSHQNIIANIQGASQYVPILADDRFFSFLPLSHVLERTGSLYVSMYHGAAVYFAQSTDTIARDIKRAKPTIMLAVPRIFERVYEKIMTKVDTGSAVKKKMFYSALGLSRQRLKGQVLTTGQRLLLNLLDHIVLSKVRAGLGGRLKFVVSGGAALDQKIAKFFQTVGIVILEGYGLTECSPIVTVNKSTDYRFGTVGQAIPGMEVRLSDEKEILIRGTSVMQGYYDDQVSTNSAIDADGWFHSGDLGSLDGDGFLTITGRIKEIIVLSNGKNINPVAVEIALNRSIYISQSLVYSPDKKTLKALLVPNFAELTQWLRERNITAEAKSELDNPMVRDLFISEVKINLKDFNSFEQVSDFKFVAEEFTQENGLMTPTLKVKRSKILLDQKCLRSNI